MACSAVSLFSDLLPDPLDWPLPPDANDVDVEPIARCFGLMADTVVLTDVSTRLHVEVREVVELVEDDSPHTVYLLNGLVAGRQYRVSGSVLPYNQLSHERLSAFAKAQDTVSRSPGPAKATSAGGAGCSTPANHPLEMRVVDAIPRDIDGDRHFVIAFPTSNFPKQVTREVAVSDERPWKTLLSSTLTLGGVKFDGPVRVASCKGGHRCKNTLCSFFEANGFPNSRSFKYNVSTSSSAGWTTASSSVVCSYCDSVDIITIPCSATKRIAWESATNSSVRNVHILHCGVHSASCFRSNPRRRALDIPSDVRGNLERLSAAGAPQGPAIHRNMSELTEQFFAGTLSQEDLLIAASASADDAAVAHVLKKSRERKENASTKSGAVSIDALIALKTKMETLGTPYLRTICHPSQGLGLPSFYFMMSDRGIDLAYAMDAARISGAHLSKEWAFFDEKHDVVVGMKTIGLHVYNTVTDKMDTIAMAHTPVVDTRTLVMFWEAVNNGVKEKHGRNFNPTGWLPDNAGCNFLSIRQVFNNGNAMPDREGSCWLHYTTCAKRVHTTLKGINKSDAEKFLDASLKFQSAVLLLHYEEAVAVIDGLGAKYKFVADFFKFWKRVGPHIARSQGQAATDSPSKTPTNLAEVVHSSLDATCAGAWSRRRPGPVPLTTHIMTMYTREVVLAGRSLNVSSGILPRTTQSGSGRATAFDTRQLRDIHQLPAADVRATDSHRHDRSRSDSSAGSAGAAVGHGAGAGAVSAAIGSASASGAHAGGHGVFSQTTVGKGQPERRLWNGHTVRWRNRPSDIAGTRMQSAWVHKDTFYITAIRSVPNLAAVSGDTESVPLSEAALKVEVVCVQKSVVAGQYQTPEFIIRLSMSPSCFCPEFSQSTSKGVPQAMCTHLMSFMMKYLGLPLDDRLLYQTAFTRTEITGLLQRLSPTLHPDAPLSLDFTQAPPRGNGASPVIRAASGGLGAGASDGAGHGAGIGAGAGGAGRSPSAVQQARSESVHGMSRAAVTRHLETGGSPWILEKKTINTRAECATKYCRNSPQLMCGNRTHPKQRAGLILGKGSYRLLVEATYNGPAANSGGRNISVPQVLSFCADSRCVSVEVLQALRLVRRTVPPCVMPVRLAEGTVPTMVEAQELLALGITYIP